jgi:hypothetical protein
MSRRLLVALALALTASPAAAQDGGVVPAPDGGAVPAPVPEEPPVVMLQGGVTATREAPKPAPKERYRTQRSFAVLANVGLIDGFGLGARIGLPRIGLDLSGGYHPILATYSQDTEHPPKYKVLSALQANATAYFGLYRIGPHADIGFAVGYKYDTVLKHGVGAAFYTQYDIAEHWSLHLFVGPVIYPKANKGIREKAGWPPDQGSVGSGLSALQGGFGLSLAFFP